MTVFDEQLTRRQEQLTRKRQLEAKAAELRRQRDVLTQRCSELEDTLRREQADVDRLEGRSLSALFYQLMGRLDEQLSREQQEACAAALQYDAAARERAAAERELAQLERELSALGPCEEEYRTLLQQKAEAVKQAGGAAAEELLHREERLAFLAGHLRELREASAAGSTALDTIDRILSRLDSARGWGTWDLLGGGLVSDMAKYSHLNSAQSDIELLRYQLRQLRTELADVELHAEMQLRIDGFLRFADYFFDGLIADWAVLDRIDRAREQVLSVEAQVTETLRRLRAMEEGCENERSRLTDELEALVREARL